MLKKKIKEIVIGSNNEGKIKEIKDLLPKYYNITSPKDKSRSIKIAIIAPDTAPL